MMGFARALTGVAVVALVGAGVGLWITRPAPLDPDLETALTRAEGDPVLGRQVFLAAGCGACHGPEGATGDARLSLAGGQRFPSDFGTFIAPNISSDPNFGIGDWSLAEFARALTEGVSPRGEHYYPAFPYAAYGHMTAQDIADLWAYLGTLPGSTTPSQPHEVGFPFNIRRSLGGWKWLFLDTDWVMADLPDDPQVIRGRYLVEAMGHCGECHTPRNPLGGLERDRWLAGAPVPGEATAKVPNITPAALDWSSEDIAYYLESGFTPEFDSVGGHMAAVVENYGQLPSEDRAAVAAYLKAVPAAN